MTKLIYTTNRKRNPKSGFSLIELSIALAVMAILATAVLPSFIKGAYIKAGEKTATEMSIIEEAARIYYIDNDAWPIDLATLQSAGYLDSSWVTNNPWNNLYSVSSTLNTFTVSTTVPTEWAQLVASSLPSTTISSGIVNSTISKPGASATSDVPSGVIVMWSGLVSNIPEGWNLCDGTGGTPDLSLRFIRGIPNSSTNPGSIGGSETHNHGGSTGMHTLTIAEMPSHNHTDPFSDVGYFGQVNLGGHSTSSGSDGGSAWDLTSSTGGNQGHSHTISSDNNVPPYFELAFIMKE